MVILDDIKDNGLRYAENLSKLNSISANFDIEVMREKDFHLEMKDLESRRKILREGKTPNNDLSTLDRTSIFIIDFDLVYFSDKSFLTGENVSYLARCFSKCGLIIGLNQYMRPHENVFDLTLKGHPESYCDINIGSTQLNNKGLWGEKATSYRPWYWPNLLKSVEDFTQKIKDVIANLQSPICEVLGLKDFIDAFPRAISDFLGDYLDKLSFEEFVIKSGNGLQGRDTKATNEMVGRIAAARITKWLERMVLPGQDILVDAPHLVSRYPSLLTGNPTRIESWNETTKFDSYDNLGLHHEKIEKFRFKKNYWLSRPAWFWDSVSEYSEIEEVSKPWKKIKSDYVFCEDISCFQAREDCIRFVAKLDSPYVHRFIKGLQDVMDYRPAIRLL